MRGDTLTLALRAGPSPRRGEGFYSSIVGS